MSIQKALIGVGAFALSVMVNMAAMGDDLEIYLGTGGDAVTYNPNVLFIMDTSGSMSNKDGGAESRMLRVQNALKEALSAATNINAGLMRFSDFGGPVLYPVRSIDDPVRPELITPIVDPLDDAYEISGSVTTGGNELRLSFGTDVVTTGLRYQTLNIPQGATITSAFLRFTSRAPDATGTDITIRGELVPNSTPFSNGANDISSRTTTAALVEWNEDNSFPFSGETVSSPDITSVIQEVVNQSGWCGGNNLNLLIESTSTSTASSRRVMSLEEGSGRTPQLVIQYDDSTATGCISGRYTYQVTRNSNNAEERSNGYQSTGSELTFNPSSNAYLGVRFNNINLPKGATITNAYLEFTGYRNRTGAGAAFRISAADEDDPNDFSPYPRYYLRDKPKTPSIMWSDIEPWYKDGVYQSPPVTSIVQHLVDRAGWEPNNEMMFIFSDIAGNRGAYTYRGKPSGAARLIIEFQGNATPGTTATVREHLISRVDELSASGFTPIVDTLYEATLYYGGMNVDYGLQRGTSSVSSTVRRNTRVSSRLSYIGADSILPAGCTEDNLSSSNCVTEYIPSGATYISPVTDLECQVNNHIVLLSDGEANNNHSVGKIEALLGKSCADTGRGGEKCGIDLVGNLSVSRDSAIDAKVTTHTIGFAANATANNFLNQLALKSGGTFHEAENSEELVNVFQTILRSVKDVNATFVSPGVAVNQLNRLTHRDELYFALFKPDEGTVWPGNLKKYRIDGDRVLDRNGLNAVDGSTGFFSESSHSYWSVLPDGNDVRDGGAASKLDLIRNVYVVDGPGNIISESNKLHESNSGITTADLSLTTAPDPVVVREQVLKWARGVDVKDDDGDGDATDVRLQMGDPIHSQPVIVNYSETDSAIFVATNHGFLHSIDAESGEENFALIPRDLLGNLYDFYQNNTSFNHIYGLDGDMVIRTTEAGTYLYVGMRRGGRNYYVFDVTSKTAPKLVFKVEGGSPGFEKLGQSWSRPTLTKIKVGGSVRNVMIVGGGYDEDQDSKEIRSPDAVGNAVYIIDADTGNLIWTASNSDANLVLDDMQYSIPARISVVDRDNDKLADHMYVADMGGQIFRLDIHNGKSGSDLVTGGLLASLGGSDAANNRRFYYGPDVAEIALGDELYYAVAIGSGFRAGPLNTTIQDNFYMIKDTGVFQIDAEGKYGLPEVPYLETNLYDATAHLLTSSSDGVKEVENTKFASQNGWMIRLGTGGEKALASPLILDYQVFFSTYLPASASTSACAPPTGNSRAYLVELTNGNAVTDLNRNGELDHEDRYAQLKQTGIAPDTKILIEDIVKPVVCLGTECVSATIEVGEDGTPEACTSDFECLAENIYGRFERVKRASWKTEVER